LKNKSVARDKGRISNLNQGQKIYNSIIVTLTVHRLILLCI